MQLLLLTHGSCLAHAAQANHGLIRKAASAAFFMHISRSYAFGLLLLGASWQVYDHYRPWVTFHSELLACLGLVALLFGVLKRSGGSVTVPVVSGWMIAVTLLVWVQYAFGLVFFAGDALLISLYMSCLWGAILVGYFFRKQDELFAGRALLGVMCCIWVAAMLSAALGMMQWLRIQHILGMYILQADLGDRAMGNLGQANQLATLLLMGVAAFAYSFEKSLFGKTTLYVGIGLLTIGLILAQSRSGLLSVIVLTSFMLWKRRAYAPRMSVAMVSAWALCFLVGSALLPFLSQSLLLDDVRSVADSGPVSERFRIWQQTAYAIAQSPWVGYGWNQIPVAHAVGSLAFPSSITYTNAHSLIFDMIAWNGLPIGLVLLSAICYWFWVRMKTLKSAADVLAMASLLPLAVHSLVEFPFVYTYFLIVAGLMVGVLEGGIGRPKTLSFPNRWLWSFWVMWVVLGGYLTYEYFLIEEDFRVVRFENLRIGQTSEEYKVPSVWMASQMAAMLKASRQSVKIDMSVEDLENLQKVSARFSYGPIRYRYALALALNGKTQEAKRQLDIIRAMYGVRYYEACLLDIRRLQQDKFPELGSLLTQ